MKSSSKKSSSKLWSACLLAIALIVAATPATAQTKMDQAEIQRSWDIQAQVASIEQNKDAFIAELIAGWAPILDPNQVGDISNELGPLMQNATAWRLYAASLVGDYRGMIQVLRGEVPAGKVINALTTPQPRSPGLSAPIGSTTNSLVFTPLPTPCRIADTRGVGARTGILAPGIARTFDLTSGGLAKGQGGSTSCPGLPSFSHFGWSVNFTVTRYSGPGHLQAYPFFSAVPATSIINYGPAGSLGAIANSSTIMGCYGCSEDLNVRANVSATDVILDVYGYFERAAGFAETTVTRFAGTPVTVGGGGAAFVSGAPCPGGTLLIGGQQTNPALSGNALTSDHFISGTVWSEFVRNIGSSGITVTVYSSCQDVQTFTP